MIVTSIEDKQIQKICAQQLVDANTSCIVTKIIVYRMLYIVHYLPHATLCNYSFVLINKKMFSYKHVADNKIIVQETKKTRMGTHVAFYSDEELGIRAFRIEMWQH